MAAFLPVFLFLGFLDSGKTTLINDLLEAGSFSKVPTLMLLTEEGEEVLQLPEPYAGLVTVQTVYAPEQLTRSQLLQWQQEARARQVIVEYNGLWPLALLAENKPGNWFSSQVFLTADGQTFPMYNQNLRARTAEHLKLCSIAMFNRVSEQVDTAVLRRLLRALNRKAAIYYETVSGDCTLDESRDQLPYDLTADAFQVDDAAFSVFQLDLRTEPQRYDGKRISFTGQFFADQKSGQMQLGRQVMTCCEADMELVLFPVSRADCPIPGNGSWIRADVVVNVAGGMPSLTLLQADPVPSPVPPVATF